MPPQVNQSSSTPPLPPGYQLDSDTGSLPPLPQGYKLDGPPRAEMRAGPRVIQQPYRKFQGPFIERATSQFGQDLQNPRNFLPSWQSLLGPPGLIYDSFKRGYDVWQNQGAPQPDPAETVGHMGIPILGGLVTHAADAIPGPAEAGAPRVPLWQKMQTDETEVPSVMNRQPYAQPARPPSAPMTAAPRALPAERLVDQIMERTTTAEPFPRLVNKISRPVTENPVVGSFVRAMDKSGLPIAERPNLLLKGSGRVNRILGPDEDLTEALSKSLRRTTHRNEQRVGR